MGFPQELALATKNPGKIREILEICSDWPVERWHFGTSLAHPERESALWPDVAETGETYLENALLKARAAAGAVGIPAVADDSGIEVDALGGDPGILSARFAGEGASDEMNLRLLLERIHDVPQVERTARYRCVAVCAWPDGRELWAEGSCDGRLILAPRGSGGFGYDPIFVPNEEAASGRGRTMAELSDDEKNAISHRGKAFGLLRTKLATG